VMSEIHAVSHAAANPHAHSPQLLLPGVSCTTRAASMSDICCREFHQALPQLLKPEGLYSFFNGCEADVKHVCGTAAGPGCSCSLWLKTMTPWIALLPGLRRTTPSSTRSAAASWLPSWPGDLR
jgi:hypothetical protein